ncbi:Cupin domain-containing protein [Pseudomonas sp. 8AS]|uniref:cupin domain-containing protein n=1 Tax=Pseudomonas sp. 8AS TaxID=2653163 RepID=UPI0012F392DE|nr:cupin domain-containing protein [Pseudomonas sp. 8AS]VXC14658.1 Cupin domain-containing protein [Pseudomonas sp. 8AS]
MKRIKDIVDLSQDVPAHSYLPKPERIINGHPQQSIRNHFSSAHGDFSVGLWEGAPGRWHVVYTEDEYCEILSGESLIYDASGNVKVVGTGDRFVIPAGFNGIWEVVADCKKVYVTFQA